MARGILCLPGVKSVLSRLHVVCPVRSARDAPDQDGGPQAPPPDLETTDTCYPELFPRSSLESLKTIVYHLGNTPVKTKTIPEIIISASTETDQADFIIEVPKQRAYTSKEIIINSSDSISCHYIVRPIPSSLANTSWIILDDDEIIKELNIALGTSYISNADLLPLRPFIMSFYDDFGTVYARLRRRLYDNWTIQDDFRAHEGEDHDLRQKALVGNLIVNPNTPPRRVWDLYSNRVVPHWSIPMEHWSKIWAISHAWVDEADRVDVRTPINSYEWPVPIPKGANLGLIRIEMLNLGAEYVWLDVLCLRLRGGIQEELREKEWKLDVLTIGNVFKTAEKVVYYFSGLGRPLRPEMDGFQSDRSWFRRAWLLQQINENYVIGGDTEDENVRMIFDRELLSLKKLNRSHVFDVLANMQTRGATHPVDQIAGLAYLLRSATIPAYYEAQSVEDAWTMLVATMDQKYRGQFFFLYPQPGSGHKKWVPTWEQAHHGIFPSMDGIQLLDKVDRNNETDTDFYSGYCIDKGDVRGLGMADPEGGLRSGELIVEDMKGKRRTFKITAAHQYPIPEESYTLIGSDPWSRKSAESKEEGSKKQYWVVGRRLEQRLKASADASHPQVFEKVSVFQIASLEVEKLDSLEIARRSRNTLI